MLKLSREDAKRLLQLKGSGFVEIEGKFWKWTGTNYKSTAGKFSPEDIQEIAYGDRLAVHEYSNGALRALVRKHRPHEYSVRLLIGDEDVETFGPWYADNSSCSWMAHEVAKAVLRTLDLGIGIAPT